MVRPGGLSKRKGGWGKSTARRRPRASAAGQLDHVYNRNEARRAVMYEGRSLRGTLYLSQPLFTFGRIQGRTARAEAELAEVTQPYAETVWQGRMFALQQTFETLEASARDHRALNAGDRTEVYELARRRHRATAARLETEARVQWKLISSLALAVQDFGQAVEEAPAAAVLIRDKLTAGRATVVDDVDVRHAVLRTEQDVLDGRLRLAGARIDLLRLLAALEPDG